MGTICMHCGEQQQEPYVSCVYCDGDACEECFRKHSWGVNDEDMIYACPTCLDTLVDGGEIKVKNLVATFEGDDQTPGSGEWRYYGAEVPEMSVDDEGNLDNGWAGIMLGRCRNPERAHDIPCPGFEGVRLPLLAHWDHEPDEAERNAVIPEEYR